MSFVIFIVFSVLVNFVVSEKLLICYYGTWATYRWGDGKFSVDHVNPELCTHLVYSFVGLDTQGNVISLDPHLDYNNDNFRKFNALKQKNPKLKTLLAVGGWSEGSGKFSVMAANPNLRQNFIQSALKMILDYDFDGFDLDWEYPARRDTVHGPADINNFSILVKELKEEFKKYGLLLTAAVSSVEASASLSYDIAEISRHLDFISIMSYDLYGAWDPMTGHNAPLFAGEGDKNANQASLYTVDNAVQFWLRQGCPPEKLVIGLPLYGRSFYLASSANRGVRAASIGAGISGPFTVSSGSVGYNEFCYMLKTQPSWNVFYDSLAQVPYAVRDRDWVSYDDPNSLTKKVEYGLKYNVAGFMVWSIETDDFHGLCSGEDFPLLRAINKAKDVIDSESGNGNVIPEVPDNTPPTTEDSPEETETEETLPEENQSNENPNTDKPEITPEEVPNNPPTVPDDVEENTDICRSEGFASDPNDCAVFFRCISDGTGGFVPVRFECQHSLLWDAKSETCNYADAVQCNA